MGVDNQKLAHFAKKTFFFFSDSDIEKAIKIYGAETLEKSKCFALSSSAFQKLTLVKIQPLQYESYFDKRRAEELFAKTQNWSNQWYKNAGLNNLKNANILPCFELSLHNYFAKKVFQLVSIEEISKREKPSLIVIGSEESGLKKIFTLNFESITPSIKLVAQKNGIEIKLLSPVMDFLTNQNLIKQCTSFLLTTILVHPKINFGKLDYIFLGHHYHIKNVLPVLSKLKRGNKKFLVVGRLGNTCNLLSDESIDYLDIEETTQISLRDPIKRMALLLHTLELNKKALESYFELDGFYLWNIFRLKIHSIITSDCLKIYYYSKIASDLIKMTTPKVVVNVSSDSSIQSFTVIARNKNVPSLEVEHGITVGSDSKHIDADKLAVWGNIPMTIYKNTGFDNKRIRITGWPAFEIYKDINAKSSKIPSMPTITFLAQDPEGVSLLFSHNTPERNLDIFFEAVSKIHRKVDVVVRLHPRADKTMPYLIAQKYNIKFRFSENRQSLLDLLSNSDIVVGQTTSATLDAIIMHKPVIYLPSMEWPASFVEGSGAVFEVATAEEIIKKINYILKNGLNKNIIEKQTKFINDYCNFSENSVENLINLIDKLSNVKKD